MSKRKELKRRSKELDSEEAELIRKTEETELRVREIDGRRHYYLKVKAGIGICADAKTTEETPKICKKCKHENKQTAKHCEECGAKL
jgi:hypothetical protein